MTRVLSAKRGADAVLLAERHQPRVAVIDLFVGSEYGVNICRAIRDRSPDTRVLLTSSSTVLTQHAARVAGATGFIAKDTAATAMLAAIRAVAHSNPRFIWRPEVARGPLSRRKQQILNLMAEGATNPRIADVLGLSLDTVKHHTTLIYRRLDVPTAPPPCTWRSNSVCSARHARRSCRRRCSEPREAGADAPSLALQVGRPARRDSTSRRDDAPAAQ